MKKDKYKFPDSPQPVNAIYVGVAMSNLNEYMGKYQISFQFWGEGNNNVFIEKDGVPLHETGGYDTPYSAITDAVRYLDKINRKQREVNPNF
jgi:hypothetical protein